MLFRMKQAALGAALLAAIFFSATGAKAAPLVLPLDIVTDEALDDGDTIEVDGSDTGEVSGVLSSSGDVDVSKTGTGTLILSNDNTFTGSMTVTGGTLQLGNGGGTGSLDSGVRIIVSSSGTLSFLRGGNVMVVELDNTLEGDGDLVFQGTGVIDESSYKYIGDTTNFTGLVTVRDGARLILEGVPGATDNPLADNAVTVEDGGTVQLSAAGQYDNDITIAGQGWGERDMPSGVLRRGALQLENGADLAGGLTLGQSAGGHARVSVIYGAAAEAVISGVIQDGTAPAPDQLEKFGDSALRLTNANTYTFGTLLTGGTLILDNDLALNSWVQRNDGMGNFDQGKYFTSQGGVVIMAANGQTIKIEDDRTLKNHFAVDNIGDPSGSGKSALAFDIASGKTLTIKDVVSAGGGWLTYGGAISINADPGGQSPGAPLKLTGGGKLSFINNQSVNGHGGAVGVYVDTGSPTLDLSGLAGGVEFIGNKARWGGAIAFMANSANAFNTASLALGDHALFRGNTATAANARGGAINTVFVSGAVTIGDYATFEGNAASNESFGMGGAIFSHSSLGKHAYFLENRAGGDNGGGAGGAIYATVSVSSLSAITALSGHTYFKGNLVSKDANDSGNSNGGAIYCSPNGPNTIILDTGTGADAGHIAFSGNRVNVDTSDMNNIDPLTGTLNSIHLASAQLDLRGDANIYFDDPISSHALGKNSLTKTGSGFVQFVGDNRLNTLNFAGANSVDVQEGAFRVVNDAATESFDATGAGNFNIAQDATLAGQGALKTSGAFTISGVIAADSDRFEIPVWTAVDANGAVINTFGTARTALAQDKRMGTLTLAGDVTLDSATIKVDAMNNQADLLRVIGTATVAGLTDVEMNNVRTGTYKIIDADTLTLAAGDGSLAANFALTGLNGLSNRIKADLYLGDDVELDVGGTVNELWLKLAVQNMTVAWKGGNGNWSDANWDGPDDGLFVDGDTVIFDAVTGTGLGAINVDNSAGVVVDSLTVSGGRYTFTGNSISGDKFTLSGGVATVDNALNFSGATLIDSGAQLRLTARGNLSPAPADITSNTSFTLKNNATLLVEPKTTAHTIASGDITFEQGSKVGVAGFGYGPMLSGGKHTVLKLVADNVSNKSALVNARGVAATSGTIAVGAYDYKYTDLAWSDDGQELTFTVEGKNPDPDPDPKPDPDPNPVPNPTPGPVYNPTRAGVPAITGASNIATLHPVFTLLGKHIQNTFLTLRTETGGATGYTESVDNSAGSGSIAAAPGAGETRYRNADQPTRIWATPYYAYTDSDSGAGYDINAPGIAAGVERIIADSAFVGLAVSLSWPSYSGGGTDIDAQDITVAAYGGAILPWGALEVDAHVGYTWTDYDQTRRVEGESYDTDYNGGVFFAGAGLGRAFHFPGGFFLRPGASYDYIRADIDGFDEGAGKYALKVDDYSQNLHRLKAGLEGGWEADNGALVSAEVYYLGLYGDTEAATTGHFTADPVNGFAIIGNGPDKNNFGFGVNVSVPVSPNWEVGIGYDLLMGSDSVTNQGTANVTFRF